MFSINTILIIILVSFSSQIIKFILYIYSKLKELFRRLNNIHLNDSFRKTQIMSKNNMEKSSLFKFKKIDFTANQDYPTRRSGHRGVYSESDDSFYIWGGFYPEESIVTRETKYNLYPEVLNRLIFK
jgi:hypothetical protein